MRTSIAFDIELHRPLDARDFRLGNLMHEVVDGHSQCHDCLFVQVRAYAVAHSSKALTFEIYFALDDFSTLLEDDD